MTDTVLRTVSEQVIGQFQEGTTFQPCATATPFNYTNLLAPALGIPAPYGNNGYYKASVSSVGYWTGSGWGSGCTSDTAPQQITVELQGPATPQYIQFQVEGTGQIQLAGATQLAAPTNVTLSTPVTPGDSGGLIITFTNSSNAAALQYYTVKACTNSAMTHGCTPVSDEFESGNELQGLVPGTPYWVTVFANASPGFLASTTTEGGPGTSSGTLSLPAVLSVTPSTTTAGSLVVTYTPESGAPNGETYTVMGCTDSAMSVSCVSQSNYTSGSQFTGLTPGTKYYVEILANTESVASLPYSPPVSATVQLGSPSSVSATSSQLQTGALVVTFGNSSGAPSGQSYTVEGCTNSAMTAGCVTRTSYTSGSQFTGLTSGSSYYVTVTAVASTGYLASTSAPTSTSTEATTQFNQPTITSVTTPNGNSGKIVVNFSGNGQTYTLIGCTNAAMTTGCITVNPYATGASATGWGKNVTVYFTVTANAASGYLASIPSAPPVSGMTN